MSGLPLFERRPHLTRMSSVPTPLKLGHPSRIGITPSLNFGPLLLRMCGTPPCPSSSNLYSPFESGLEHTTIQRKRLPHESPPTPPTQDSKISPHDDAQT